MVEKDTSDDKVATQVLGQTPGAAAQAGGQQGAKPDAGGEQQQGDAGKYLTLEEASKLIGEQVSKQIGGLHSLIAKTGNRLTQVQEKINALEESWKLQAEAGQPVSAEVQQRLKEKVITDALTTPDTSLAEPSPAQAEPQPGSETGDSIDPVTAEAYSIMQEAGVYIEDDDPEIETIKSDGTIREFLGSVERAIEAKRQRIATRTPTNMGGTGSYNPNPIANITDPDELWKLVEQSGRL